MKSTTSLVNAAINTKFAGFNIWILKVYKCDKENRTFKEFYLQMLFCFANLDYKPL